MKISIDGLPGCRKDEIFKALKDKHGLDVNSSDDLEWNQMFLSDSKKNAFGYELNRLINFHYQYDGPNKLYDSLYSLKKIYVEYLSHEEVISKQEYEVFMKYYRLLYQQPDVIIYFYGTYENTFRRMNERVDYLGDDHQYRYSDEEFKKLHYLYEWVFDNNNCKVPIFKINVDDDLNYIISNLMGVLDKVEKVMD